MPTQRERKSAVSHAKTNPNIKTPNEELRNKLATRINGATSQQLEIWAQTMLSMPERENSLTWAETNDFQPASTNIRVISTEETQVEPAKDRLNRLGIQAKFPTGENVDESESCRHEPAGETPVMVTNKVLISDAYAVGHFLEDRIKRLQQIPIKRIAKAWIKGICPRKQTLYPYKKKVSEKRTIPGVPPPWWPCETECRFREPDHIGRRERIALCLHLLRLRPTPDQLSTWNGGKNPPSNVHIAEGWTEFLMKLAPVSVLEEFQDVSQEKAARRRQLLRQIYHVALLEEDYQDRAVDDDYTFTYYEPEEPQNKILKRSREYSVVARQRNRSRSCSSTGSRFPVKKQRRNTNNIRDIASPLILKDEQEDWMDTEVDSDVDAECIPDLETPFQSFTSTSAAALSQALPASTCKADTGIPTRKAEALEANNVPSQTKVLEDVKSYQQTVPLSMPRGRDTKDDDSTFNETQMSYNHHIPETRTNTHVSMPNLLDIEGLHRRGAAVYQTDEMPHPNFGITGSMPPWYHSGMQAMLQGMEIYGAPLIAEEPMAMIPHTHPSIPTGSSFPHDTYVYEPHMTMMPFSHGHFQPMFRWPSDGILPEAGGNANDSQFWQ